jgi:hypothetical protein
VCELSTPGINKVIQLNINSASRQFW